MDALVYGLAVLIIVAVMLTIVCAVTARSYISQYASETMLKLSKALEHEVARHAATVAVRDAKIAELKNTVERVRARSLRMVDALHKCDSEKAEIRAEARARTLEFLQQMNDSKWGNLS